jgi:retron-type reverse transcriptase
MKNERRIAELDRLFGSLYEDKVSGDISHEVRVHHISPLTVRNKRKMAKVAIYANKGAMTPGIDGMTLDGFGGQRVLKLMASLKDHHFQPQSVKRVYIPKKNGKSALSVLLPRMIISTNIWCS